MRTKDFYPMLQLDLNLSSHLDRLKCDSDGTIQKIWKEGKERIENIFLGSCLRVRVCALREAKRPSLLTQ